MTADGRAAAPAGPREARSAGRPCTGLDGQTPAPPRPPRGAAVTRLGPSREHGRGPERAPTVPEADPERAPSASAPRGGRDWTEPGRRPRVPALLCRCGPGPPPTLQGSGLWRRPAACVPRAPPAAQGWALGGPPRWCARGCSLGLKWGPRTRVGAGVLVLESSLQPSPRGKSMSRPGGPGSRRV